MKINKLKYGSIIPVLKYRFGKIPQRQVNPQIIPNDRFFILLPIINKTRGVKIDNKALGKRAANAETPKNFIDKNCNQKNNGGFS